MLTKMLRITKAIYARQIFFKDPITIGEVVKSSKIPYSTVRRFLIRAEELSLVESEIRPYKSTGKRVFWLTEKGEDLVLSARELI